jgi:large subunit ribosomal protein L33
VRDIVILACVECKERNYTTTKNKRTQTGRIEYKKYCPRCNARTVHKESK